MEFKSAHNSTTAKLPNLKLIKYKIWVIRIKQYFQVQDYALWKVIKNGNLWVFVPQITQETGTSVTKMDEATKKTQKTLLKQQYENCNASSTKLLDSIFNRLQKIVSRLSILVWMNKADIETMSIDDLYNNFKIVKQDVKKSVVASTGAQNIAFMTTLSTNSTNDNACKISTASSNVNTASPQTSSANIKQIHEDDLEAMNLKWQLSLLSMRENRYYQKTGKKIFINANDTAGYDKSKCDDLLVKLNQTEFTAATYKRDLAIIEEQLITYKKNEVLFSEEVKVLKMEVACKEYEIGVLKSEFEKVKQEKEGIDFKIEKFDNASKSLDKLRIQLDLSYSGLDEFKEPEFKGYGPQD
ncbi:hypothetical protein Tco_0608895, partial [Tanacetum coccineum]